MTLNRVFRIGAGLLGFVVGVAAVIVAYFSRRMIAPVRQAVWSSPTDLGLDYESVAFPAQDGVRLSGWFVPASRAASRDGATIILLHSWGWNRQGDAANDLAANFSGAAPVELLRLAHALHYEGYHVLLFDQRNHGESAALAPVTFGQAESNDLLGALSYLTSRDDVDPNRIGAVGFSMGANTILYALPRTTALAAAVAVEPASTALFAERYARDVLGPVGPLLLPFAEMVYTTAGGVPLSALQPSFAASGAGNVPVLYIQAKHDQWGSVEDVNRLARVTPHGEGPLYVDGTHHYHGFQYVLENPKVLVAFFEQYM